MQAVTNRISEHKFYITSVFGYKTSLKLDAKQLR